MTGEHYGKRDDDTWIEDTGIVVRLLSPDDAERHQRFVVRVGGGQTLLVAHNPALAGHIPVGIGDRIAFRGLYEWNDSGGLVHWTHGDPHGEIDGGWIRHRRQRYS